MNAKDRANLRLRLTFGGKTLMDDNDLLELLNLCDEAENVTDSATPESITSVANDIESALFELESIASGLRMIQRRCGA